MNVVFRFCGLLIVVGIGFVLGACGGGTTRGTSVLPAAVPTQAPVNRPAAKGPLGQAKLVIRLPAHYHQASTAGGARKPAFVDPLGSRIDIYDVDSNQYAFNAVDGTASPVKSVPLPGPTGDNTQIVDIPLYSTDSNQIVAIEYDSSYNVLAIGETDLGSFTPSASPLISLTMLEYVVNIAIGTNADGTGATTLSDLPVTCSGPCGSNAQSDPFYFFAVDNLNVFTDLSGVGGQSVPSVTGSTINGTPGNYNRLTPLTGGALGAYALVTGGAASTPISVTVSAPNPAADVFNEALFNNPFCNVNLGSAARAPKGRHISKGSFYPYWPGADWLQCGALGYPYPTDPMITTFTVHY